MNQPELSGVYHADVDMLMAEIDRLNREKASAPRGQNRHGLDANYFHGKLEIINRDIGNMTPAEMSRSLMRLAMTADSEVLTEKEFQSVPEITNDMMRAADRAVTMHDGKSSISIAGYVLAAVWGVLEGQSVDQAVRRTAD